MRTHHGMDIPYVFATDTKKNCIEPTHHVVIQLDP